MLFSKLTRRWAMLLALVALFGFSACNNDDDNMLVYEDMTISDVLNEEARFTTFLNALQRTNVDALLADENAEVTVFAPTNDAFTALGIDLSTLTDEEVRGIVLYHIYGVQSVLSNQIQEGRTYLNTQSATGPADEQLTLLIERTGPSITINNTAAITDADITTENGTIHALNAVLMPLDVTGHVMANDDFSELADALAAAAGELIFDLADEEQTYTLFAPINDAFLANNDFIMDLSDTELAALLSYHIVAGTNLTNDMLMDGQMLTTLQGENLTVDIDGNVATLVDAQGTRANILFLNIQATNGLVHVINDVVMPSTIN